MEGGGDYCFGNCRGWGRAQLGEGSQQHKAFQVSRPARMLQHADQAKAEWPCSYQYRNMADKLTNKANSATQVRKKDKKVPS